MLRYRGLKKYSAIDQAPSHKARKLQIFLRYWIPGLYIHQIWNRWISLYGVFCRPKFSQKNTIVWRSGRHIFIVNGLEFPMHTFVQRVMRSLIDSSRPWVDVLKNYFIFLIEVCCQPFYIFKSKLTKQNW